jgi:hypothetical protein
VRKQVTNSFVPPPSPIFTNFGAFTTTGLIQVAQYWSNERQTCTTGFTNNAALPTVRGVTFPAGAYPADRGVDGHCDHHHRGKRRRQLLILDLQPCLWTLRMGQHAPSGVRGRESARQHALAGRLTSPVRNLEAIFATTLD